MSDEPKQPSKWIMQIERECIIWVGGILFGVMYAVCLIFLSWWFTR